MVKNYRGDTFVAIHEAMEALHEIGAAQAAFADKSYTGKIVLDVKSPRGD